MMEEGKLESLVQRLVLTELALMGDLRVPANASNRHIHLCQKDVDALFSPGYRLTPMRELMQPGQYACQEQVVMEGPGGQLRLRVVGPVRSKTQIELSHAEAVRLGIPPVLRLSGDTGGTPGCWLSNGQKRTQLMEGVIVAQRHLHLSPEEASAYGLANGDRVCLYVGGPRRLTFHDVIVRSGPGHVLEAHLDREEANAAGLVDGQLCRIITGREKPGPEASPAPGIQPPAGEVHLECTPNGRGYLGEGEVLAYINAGATRIVCPKGTIISPLARDAAWENKVELAFE